MPGGIPPPQQSVAIPTDCASVRDWFINALVAIRGKPRVGVFHGLAAWRMMTSR